MKKLGLLSTLLVGSLLLTGCNNNCNCDVPICEEGETQTNEAKAICLENKGTYSRITEPEGEHGECMFPSGIGCWDEMVLEGECNWQPATDDIDTEEERFDGCKENVTGWFEDMMEGAELNDVEYSDQEEEVKDEEGNITMINRNFKAKFTRDGQNWILDGTCEADFVRGGLGTTYNEEYLDE